MKFWHLEVGIEEEPTKENWVEETNEVGRKVGVHGETEAIREILEGGNRWLCPFCREDEWGIYRRAAIEVDNLGMEFIAD